MKDTVSLIRKTLYNETVFYDGINLWICRYMGDY